MGLTEDFGFVFPAKSVKKNRENIARMDHARLDKALKRQKKSKGMTKKEFRAAVLRDKEKEAADRG